MKIPALMAALALTLAMAGCSSQGSTVSAPAAPELPAKCHVVAVRNVEQAYEKSIDLSVDRTTYASIILFALDKKPSLSDSKRKSSPGLTWFLNNYGECLSIDARSMVEGWRDEFAANGQ
jgi:hypothetical protein